MALSVALGAWGCAATRGYDLQPVAHAGDGMPPVKAQVRRVVWADQPESGDLFGGAEVSAEVDLYDADPARTFVAGALRLEARPALGGPARALVPQGQETTEDAAVPSNPNELVLRPHETRTLWVTFEVPEDDPPRGIQRLVVIVPISGQPDLELPIADPVAGGPRWRAGRVRGLYAISKFGGVGKLGLDAMEPVGFAVRFSRERWVLGFGGTLTYLYQQTFAGGPPAFGLSVHAQLTFAPWTSRFAPYVEVGSFNGFQDPPTGYTASRRGLELPRASLGVLVSFGGRLGATGALPFEHELSPQHVFGLRVAYTRWFNTGEAGGSEGLEIGIERGFGP
jgi:hypothetical protein